VAKQKSTFQSLSTSEQDNIEPIPSQSPNLKEDTKDTLIAWKLEKDIQILVVILLVAIILVVGFINRRVEKALLLALFLSGIVIAIFFALLG
jgi:uncharacterized membrane protein